MRYFFKRLGFYLLAFVGAIALNFFLPRMMPGNPVQMYLGQMYQAGGKVDPAVIKAVEKMYGFTGDETLLESFFNYLVNVFHGDWGVSFSNYPHSVLETLGRSMKWTIFLCGVSLILSFIITTLLGIYVAWRRGTKRDTVITVTGQVLSNIPAVIIALILSYSLAYTGYFPRGYAVTPLMTYASSWDYIKDVAYHAFLPCLAILLTSLSGIMGMRANMINQLGEDYIVMGIAKGVPDKKIMLAYGARNALLPAVTSLAMSVGFLLGGSLLVEQIFNYPGLGKVMLMAINGRDYPLMQGILLMSTLLMLTCNFIADIGSYLIDPRLRVQGAK